MRRCLTLCLVVGIALAASCASSPTRPVAYGEFCDRLGSKACGCLAKDDSQKEASCYESFQSRCVGTRDTSAVSGKTESETAACESALATDCDGILVGRLPKPCPLMDEW